VALGGDVGGGFGEESFVYFDLSFIVAANPISKSLWLFSFWYYDHSTFSLSDG
jgi:hypothetical protein